MSLLLDQDGNTASEYRYTLVEDSSKIRAGVNKVLIKPDGLDGFYSQVRGIYIDPDYNPGQHTAITGTVISTPNKLKYYGDTVALYFANGISVVL